MFIHITVTLISMLFPNFSAVSFSPECRQLHFGETETVEKYGNNKRNNIDIRLKEMGLNGR